MTLPVAARAPATTANLGPGFDSAAVALDLWNDLTVEEADGLEVLVEGEGADELPGSAEHLGVRAFALLEPLDGKRFRFTNRIPLARGLGSSAATIALGLAAASLVQGRFPDAHALLARALELESHADNVAAALAGGACLTWAAENGQRFVRVAERVSLVPIAVVPAGRVSTEEARAALPAQVAHGDAAFTVGRGTLLGAALALERADLLADAFDDRLHEPYRAATAPAFAQLRRDPPRGGAGVTISGSGPTVIVWARPGTTSACVAELEERFPEARVLRLEVTDRGAGPRPSS
jgi:homoserine kinase